MHQRSSKLSTILLFLAAIFTKFQFEVAAAADSISYIGAVAEYHPITNGANGRTISKENAKNYVTIIKNAWKFNADIVVFPEDSLTAGLNHSDTDRSEYPFYSSVIPEAGTDSPCDNSSSVVIEALRLISCAAKDHSIYVVVNLHEMVNCTIPRSKNSSTNDCPTDDYLFYNTNVVFNRTGGIISKYRKYNLFAEPGINVTSKPENATFETDFNVTFGHIICFDIYFKTPALTLVRDLNVTDIVHPARWFSELPYLTSIQTQSSWSYENDVNLLSSGYNAPKTGNGGSGIHSGYQGTLVKLWTENLTNSILVARIPKVVNGTRAVIKPDEYYPLVYNFTEEEIPTFVNETSPSERVLFKDDFEAYKTELLPHENGRTVNRLQLCDRGLCCNFFIDRTFGNISGSIGSDLVHYRQRIAVFNGVRSFAGSVTAGVQICSLISCTNETLASCGLRFAKNRIVEPTFFNGISISANFFNQSGDAMQMPNSLIGETMLPLNSGEFNFRRENIVGSFFYEIEYNLTSPVEGLISFAIYGRNFSNDGNDVSDHSSDAVTPFFKFILAVTTAATVLNIEY